MKNVGTYGYNLEKPLSIGPYRETSPLGCARANIKRMVGKSIPISDDTYLAGLKLKKDFIELRKILSLRGRMLTEE